MKRFFYIFALVMLMIAFATSAFASEGNYQQRETMKTYFVAFQNDIDLGLIKGKGGELARQYKYMPVIAVKLPEQAVQSLSKNPTISYIEQDRKIQAIGQVTPWGIKHSGGINAQQTGVTGLGIKIGIIDSGIDYTHEDLQVKGGATFVEGTTNYMDDNGHGTHVAGTVAALTNDVGVLGMAPQSDLYAIKVVDQFGGGSYSDVIAGIEWAISNNMDIVNMSLGGTSGSKTLKTAVDNAYERGILLVAAAGNNGYDKKGTITYPAKYDSVVAVGAIDSNDNRANFSSVGRDLELMAPGVGIISTVLGGYGSYDGTSMASPHVAGAAALVWEAKSGLNNIELRNVLNESALTLGDSFSYGNGLIDVLKALNYEKTAPVKVNGYKKISR